MGIPIIPSVDSDTKLFPAAVQAALRTKLSDLPAVAVAAGSTGQYSAARRTYNFKSSNTRRLRATLAKAKAGTAIAKIGMLGDSTCAGYPTAATKSAPMQMRHFLEFRGYPVNGTGPVIANPGGAPGGYTDPRYTTTGTWTTQAGNPNGILQTTQVGATIAFASDRVGTTVDVSYLDLGAGWSYSVDGAASVAIPASGGTGSLARVTVTGLSSAVHTITITVNSVPNGGAFYLNWVNVHGAVSGLEVGNFGVNGTTTNDWTNQTFYYPQMTLRDWGPDVVFLDLGINDWGSTGTPQTDAATFKARTQTIINAFKGSADVILVTSNPYNGVDYSQYNAVKYQLADSNDLPLIDIYELFESYAISNPLGLYSDSAHPSIAGYVEKGSTLAAAIS